MGTERILQVNGNQRFMFVITSRKIYEIDQANPQTYRSIIHLLDWAVRNGYASPYGRPASILNMMAHDGHEIPV